MHDLRLRIGAQAALGPQRARMHTQRGEGRALDATEVGIRRVRAVAVEMVVDTLAALKIRVRAYLGMRIVTAAVLDDQWCA